MKGKIRKILTSLIFSGLMLLSNIALALDPMTKASNKIESTLFGGFGLSMCSIILGATFLMAKVGKISWDKFLFTGMCCAGFLGAPSLINTLAGWVR